MAKVNLIVRRRLHRKCIINVNILKTFLKMVYIYRSNDESESSNNYHIDEESRSFDMLESEMNPVADKKTYEFSIKIVNSRNIAIYKSYNLSVIKTGSADLYNTNPETYAVNQNSIDYYKKQLQFLKITV